MIIKKEKRKKDARYIYVSSNVFTISEGPESVSRRYFILVQMAKQSSSHGLLPKVRDKDSPKFLYSCM